MYLRRWVQTGSAIILNSHLSFFLTGKIFQGSLKAICQPGLSCFSCPLAITSCPLGMIQFFFANLKINLTQGVYWLGISVIGFLGVIGSLVGRMQCAWLCPFGFIQDGLYLVPVKKISIPGWMKYGKYILLVFTVFILPAVILDNFGYGEPWFCKYICPAGTLEAGVPLIIADKYIRPQLGWLFTWKSILLIGFLIWMTKTKRPFCRTVCPLGAVYGLFNKHSLFRLSVDKTKCTQCDECLRTCPMDLKVYESPNDENCIRCLECKTVSCQYGAIDYQWLTEK